MSYTRKDFIALISAGAGSFLAGRQPFYAEAVTHPLLKVPPLKRGDTIGMISPASSLPGEEDYDKIAATIEGFGFQVKIGTHARDHYGYLAGTDENRAADLNAMFADPEVNAILPFRGGWGSNRLLEYIDYEAIRQNPKMLIGFSDITTLLLAIYARTGLVTYHGPVGKSEWTTFTRSYFRKGVMQSQPFRMQSKKDITTLRSGRAAGTLLGGNLSVLTSMLGSAYLPRWRNSILFLEDVGEDVYRIDRMMTQLRLNGVLEQINGLIFGQCTNCGVSSGHHFTLEQMLKDHIKEYEIPAFVGANIGHIDDMFTLPIGIRAEMDADTGTIGLLEAPTKPDT